MSFVQELAQWLQPREAAYSAVSTEVAAAISAGFSLETIWAHLHETGKFPFPLGSFLAVSEQRNKNRGRAGNTPYHS